MTAATVKRSVNLLLMQLREGVISLSETYIIFSKGTQLFNVLVFLY